MVGTVLRARYEIGAPLLEGPVFAAYSARDRMLQRDVCVRIVRPPFDSELPFANALQEVVERLSALQHPRIEALWEVDTDKGAPFIVGELTKGVSLADKIRKLAPFSVPVSVSIAVNLLEGLSALHAAGLVHGDVSASNVWIEPDGSAKLQLPLVWKAYSASNTAGSVVLPSMAAYLAPEISTGGEPNPASDLYAVGVLLYQLLTGRLPFPADTPLAMALKHATEPIPNVRDLNKSIPSVMTEIVKKALAKDPHGRYATAAEMLRDLSALQHALRFGKTITWPIKPENTSDVAPRQVAPQMSAVKVESRRPDLEREWERDPGDVPVWLRNALIAVVVIVAFLIGAFLWSNMTRPKLVTVPNVRNMSLNEARNALEESNLVLRILAHVPNENVPGDSVIDSSPAPGTKVRERSEVAVRLSSGSRLIEVPDLTGRTVDEARSILGQLGLALDDSFDEIASSTMAQGLIVSESPKKGAKVERSTLIRVQVSNGQNPGVSQPEASDQALRYVYTLKVHLTDLTEPTRVRIEIQDDVGTRTIFDADKEPGDSISLSVDGHGKEATFNVYYNDQLIKTVVKEGAETN